jgi:hypothetical protein
MDGARMRRRLLLALALTALAAPAAAAAEQIFRMQLGSAFTVTGRTGSFGGVNARATGKVLVEGRWGSGRWHVLARTKTDRSGKYRFVIRPERRGTLTLRIEPPDHHPRRYVLDVR